MTFGIFFRYSLAKGTRHVQWHMPQDKGSFTFYTFLHTDICMFCRMNTRHIKKKKLKKTKKLGRDIALSFCQTSTKVSNTSWIRHGWCRGFNCYLELKNFFYFFSCQHISFQLTLKKQINTLEYTADYPLNWNPLMINHDPAYIYTLDRNNSKHIQLKRKM